jgi:hypothetical protein
MTTPPPLGLAPYVSPLILQNAPTGIDLGLDDDYPLG